MTQRKRETSTGIADWAPGAVTTTESYGDGDEMATFGATHDASFAHQHSGAWIPLTVLDQGDGGESRFACPYCGEEIGISRS